MKFCIIIPSYNHNQSLAEVLKSVENFAKKDADIIVVDDGSTPPVSVAGSTATLVRIAKNSGKANALRVAFESAKLRGFTHAITMDADGQHSAQSIPDFLEAARKFPDAIIVGTRNFDLPQVPKARRFLNKFSNFWFRYETGTQIADTQCGFRCYPLAVFDKLKINFSGFVFETELLVKSVWAQIELKEISVPTVYTQASLEKSHYKPFSDTLKFSLMNTRLSFMATFFPKSLLKYLSTKRA